MKRQIHPHSHLALFKDVSTGDSFLTSTTLTSNEFATGEDGQSYPLIKVDISSASHPFYTKKTRTVDGESRAEKFKKKYNLN